jgi:hypothetical protein
MLWALSGGLFFAQQQTPAILVESKTVDPGTGTTIDITVMNLPSPGVNDVQGTLSYNPTVMRVKTLTPLSGFTLFASFIDNGAGEVQFAIAIVGGSPVSQGGLVRLEVEAVGQPGQQTPLELSLDVFRDPNGDPLFPAEQLAELIQNGTFTIAGGGGGPPPVEGEVTVHVFPNPAKTTAKFKYTLPSGTSEATLWIFNLRGDLVFSKPLDVNTNQFNWNLKGANGQDVPNGPYYFRVSALTSAGGRSSPVGRLLVQR